VRRRAELAATDDSSVGWSAPVPNIGHRSKDNGEPDSRKKLQIANICCFPARAIGRGGHR
jgi:hypothetical protein